MKLNFCNDRSGKDKFDHFFVSFLIGALLACIVSFIPFSPWWAASITFIGTVAIGICKEIGDSRQRYNHFCVWDLLYDCLGALIASVMAWVGNYFTYAL